MAFIPTSTLSVCLSVWTTINSWKGGVILAIFVASSNPSKYYQMTRVIINKYLIQIQ